MVLQKILSFNGRQGRGKEKENGEDGVKMERRTRKMVLKWREEKNEEGGVKMERREERGRWC